MRMVLDSARGKLQLAGTDSSGHRCLFGVGTVLLLKTFHHCVVGDLLFRRSCDPVFSTWSAAGHLHQLIPSEADSMGSQNAGRK